MGRLPEGESSPNRFRILELNSRPSFVVQSIGYKYVFISTPPASYLRREANPIQVIAVLSGILAVLSIPFMDETYAPVVRVKYDMASDDPEKARNARRHLGPDVQLGGWGFLWINLSRPIMLLTRSFICFVLSLYMALIYGIYYLMFATFSGTCYPIPNRTLFLTQNFLRTLHTHLRVYYWNLWPCLSRPRHWFHHRFRVWCPVLR